MEYNKNNENINSEVNNIKNRNWLFGFRSNKSWKKLVSILYFIICILYLIIFITQKRYVNITLYDFVLNKICNLILLFIMISPYIFLSDTKFRKKLPLFKKYNLGASILGMVITTLLFTIIFSIVLMSHSKEYLADINNHAYKEISSEAATCENTGRIKYQCDYCGIKKTEKIPVLGHKMKEISRKDVACESEGVIDYICERCEFNKTEIITASGHKMKEVSRKKATCESEGEVNYLCESCEFNETEKIPALEHKMKEVSRKEATETENGEIINECEVCKKKEVVSIEKEKKETAKTLPTSVSNEKLDSEEVKNNSQTNDTITPVPDELTGIIDKEGVIYNINKKFEFNDSIVTIKRIKISDMGSNAMYCVFFDYNIENKTDKNIDWIFQKSGNLIGIFNSARLVNENMGGNTNIKDKDFQGNRIRSGKLEGKKSVDAYYLILFDRLNEEMGEFIKLEKSEPMSIELFYKENDVRNSITIEFNK